MKKAIIWAALLFGMAHTAFAEQQRVFVHFYRRYVLSLITLLISFTYFIYLCNFYRNKPFGNKFLDVIAITMCIIGFAYSEDTTLIGCITLIAALIDLVYFWFLYCCDKKHGCN